MLINGFIWVQGEDNVQKAVEDLIAKVEEGDAAGFTHYVYIGITCGLSAPYVGAQIDYTMNGPHSNKFTTVLIGFNDAAAARKTPIENWNKTMYDVVSQLASRVGDGSNLVCHI